MKKLLTLALVIGTCFAARAQSAKIILISNDGTLQATNQVTLSASQVSGLVVKWKINTVTRTNAGLSALTFANFIFQELSDKGDEWNQAAATSAIAQAGLTNSYPPILAQKWFLLSTNQQANAVAYFNAVGQ